MVVNMASCCRRRYSRRRLAALSFLSNISLDGTHQDTKLGLLSKNLAFKDKAILKNENAIKCNYSSKDESNLPTVCSNHGNEASNVVNVDEQIDVENAPSLHALNVKNDVAHTVSEDVKVKIPFGTFRERAATIGSNECKVTKSSTTSCIHPGLAIRRSVIVPGLAILPLDDKHNIQLSTDNMEHAGLLVPASRSRRISSNTSESSHSPTGSGMREKEVRFVASIRDLSNHLADQRFVLVTGPNHCVPIMVFSTLAFSKNNKLSRGDFRGDSGRRRHASGSRPLSSIGDYPDLYTMLGLPKPDEGQVVSYSQLLVPSRNFNRESGSRRLQSLGDYTENDVAPHKMGAVARCLSYDSAALRTSHGRPASPLLLATENTKMDVEDNLPLPHSSNHLIYHPNLLDDPELIAGKHSTLLTFPSYVTSVIDYVKPSDLKKELNDKFREKFPHVQLTLSKLRSLKREMRKVAKQESGADLLTVAQAYVYFEKLILRGLVHKGNRKLCASAALLLSAKMNDVKGETLKTLIEKIENTFRINRKELLAAEFAVLVALEFGLHVPTWEIFPHYQRLLYDS